MKSEHQIYFDRVVGYSILGKILKVSSILIFIGSLVLVIMSIGDGAEGLLSVFGITLSSIIMYVIGISADNSAYNKALLQELLIESKEARKFRVHNHKEILQLKELIKKELINENRK